MDLGDPPHFIVDTARQRRSLSRCLQGADAREPKKLGAARMTAKYTHDPVSPPILGAWWTLRPRMTPICEQVESTRPRPRESAQRDDGKSDEMCAGLYGKGDKSGRADGNRTRAEWRKLVNRLLENRGGRSASGRQILGWTTSAKDQVIAGAVMGERMFAAGAEADPSMPLGLRADPAGLSPAASARDDRQPEVPIASSQACLTSPGGCQWNHRPRACRDAHDCTTLRPTQERAWPGRGSPRTDRVRRPPDTTSAGIRREGHTSTANT